MHQPVLNSDGTIAQIIGVSGLLHAELREVADAVWYQLAALGCVELSLFVEQVVHILLVAHNLCRLVAVLEGEQKGINQTNERVATDMLLKKKFSISIIAEISKLSEDVVRGIAKSIGVTVVG